MSNDISRVYQFLAKFNENGRTWIDEADTSGDGYVIKSEFRTFMEDFEWDGETSQEAKNDLINSFWKTIDTNKKTSKIKGTKLRNNNALDNNEVAAMEYKIKGYETLNNYLAATKAPNVIRDGAAWKQKINESLLNKVEEFLASKRPIEELAPYLEEIGITVQNMTTADLCADQYLNSSEIKNLLKEYNYTYDKGTELYEIISNFVQNIPADSSPESIQSTVIELVNAYLATAGLKEDDGAIDLADYGYAPDENSALNELQKAVAEKEIRNNLAAIKNESSYEKYEEVYQAAIEEFITNTIADANYNEFETIKALGIEEFKKTDSYKNIELTIKVNSIFKDGALKKALEQGIGENIANKIGNLMSGEIPAFDEIKEKAVEKAKSGDFNTNNKLDEQKLINWVVEQIKTKLIDFYPNGLDNMSIEELNVMYDSLAKSARENDNLDQFKNAALMYCDALTKKNIPTINNAVKEVFGTDYATAIARLTSAEIDEKMNKLKTKVLEIGNVTDCKVTNWNGLPADGSKILTGQTLEHNISVNITDKNNKVINSNRISYGVQTNGNCSATINDLGKLSITGGNAEGHANITIIVMVDGVEIETKTVSLECRKLTAKEVANNIGRNSWGGSYNHCEVYGMPNVRDHQTQMSSNSFADLYNNNAVILLDRGKDKDYNESRVTDNLVNVLNLIKNAMSTVLPDSAKLNTAVTNVLNTLLANITKDSSHDNTEREELGGRVTERIKAGKYSGIVNFADTDNKDYRVTMVSFKEIVDMIFNTYERL